MTGLVRAAVVAALVAPAGLAASPAASDEAIHGPMSTYQEVPALSTDATAEFRAKVVDDGAAVEWELSYADLSSPIQQSHLHFGQRGVNGRIVVFLCTNLGNSPTAQLCPPAPATITGRFTAADVIATGTTPAPANQGLLAGQFDEFVAAIRAGVVYANVHTVNFPAGEIRGQLKASREPH